MCFKITKSILHKLEKLTDFLKRLFLQTLNCPKMYFCLKILSSKTCVQLMDMLKMLYYPIKNFSKIVFLLMNTKQSY